MLIRLRVKLKEVLREKNLTEEKLADSTIIDLDVITKLAEGYTEHLTVEDLEMIATTLGITDIRELLELVDIDDFSKEQGLLM